MYDDEDDDFQGDLEDSPLTPREQAESFVRTAVLFESALAFVAVGLGWLLNTAPWVSASYETGSGMAVLAALGLGALATIPLLLAFVWLQYADLPSLEDLHELMEQRIVPLFREASYLELGFISLAAGLGEEALFRGVIQTFLQTTLGPESGPLLPILLTSLLFGLVHSLNREYFVLSTIMGIYLGAWFWYTGDIIVPIVIHALYDWFALIYMKQTTPEPQPDGPDS